MRLCFICLLCWLSIGVALPADNTEFSAEQLEFFEKQVRPLLVEHCVKCHGSNKQEANLRLDSRGAILKGGDTGPAVEPGQPTKSELVLAVSYDPAGYQMPPDGKLSEEQIAIFTRWVELGAPWPAEDEPAATDPAAKWEEEFARRMEHWSFLPLTRRTPPTVQDSSWCRTPIDRFVLARLEEAGLPHAEEADRRTWLRRLSLDVTGLPPTSDEVNRFLADESPGAHERAVDRLLASPHFGERWGRHWLDLVRYAESRGHEFDHNVANAWPYRDYVIRALNADVPYDRFVIEHVAGDQLSDPGPVSADDVAAMTEPHALSSLRLDPATGVNESVLGTGFWFFGEWVHSPVDIRQEEADRFDNMIDVYSKTFLGLTVACARCHDHKFDPIPQSDFYALQGYLQSSSYRQARFETEVQNRRVGDELQRLRRDAAAELLPLIQELARPVMDRRADYLLAAREVLSAGAIPDDLRKETVFADFETGGYDGWETTGDAFGTGPQSLETIAPYQGRINAVGKYFVNSHQLRDGGRGDTHVGTLTSPEFTIDFPSIQFWIGGGSHAGKTCVNLLVDGEVALSATGHNENQMSLVSWDVTKFRGGAARVQVVDQETGGWGNIGIDHIVFVRSSAEDSSETGVESIARERGLNAQVLTHWVRWLRALGDEPDVFPVWRAFASGKDFDAESLTREVEASFAEALRHPPGFLAHSKNHPGDDFFSADELIADGAGFVGGAAASGDEAVLLTADPAHPVSRRVTREVLEWDKAWPEPENIESQKEPGATESWSRAGRMVRTPTFDITSDKVYCLVRGGMHSYVAVDSHVLIRGPLHGSLTKTHPANDEWHWIEHDVSRYKGHRAHVELVRIPGQALAVREVFQADAPPREPSFDLAADATWPMDLSSVEATAAKLAESIDLDWRLAEPQLFGLDALESAERLSALSEPLLRRQQALYAEVRPRSQVAPAMLDGSGEDEYVFIRGNWKKRGEIAPRQFLSAFPNPSSAVRPVGVDGEAAVPTGHSAVDAQLSTRPGSGRLELALQMVDPEQTPIVARVIVNRIWQHYLGKGIVPTPDDLGYLGTPPTHPELLDWLATELIAHGWSLKHIHRLILTSSTYRMASEMSVPSRETGARSDPGSTLNMQVDPGNSLLWRMNVKRMEGEVIRDAIMAVSGRLDDELYGLSVPIHLTSFLEGRGRPGESGPVDGHGRRSLYLSVRRNFAEPFFQAFDFPNPHSTIGRRNVSNVPAQALALMNNPMVIEQSRITAERLLAATAGESTGRRIERLFLTLFSRPPSETEGEIGREFIAEQSATLQSNTDDPRVWADYVHVLLNAKEFAFVR